MEGPGGLAPRLRDDEDPGPGGGPAGGVRGPVLHRDAQLGGRFAEGLGEAGYVPGELHPGTPEVGRVQGDLEDGAELVDERGQGEGLGRQPVRGQEGRRPLGLFGPGGR